MQNILGILIMLLQSLTFVSADGSDIHTITVASVVTDSANVHATPDSSSPVVGVLNKGDTFPVLKSSLGDYMTSPANAVRKKPALALKYYEIQMLGGKTGWIRESQIETNTLERLLMGWNYAGDTATYIRQIQNKQSLNVVSPRWYLLNDTDSLVSDSAEQKYVNAAHSDGKKVWPLFGNKFDSVLTDHVLSNPTKRQKLVATLRNSLVQANVDGINVDFENIDPKNKKDYVAFIRELKAALKQNNITVSVDVTRTNEDPFWSGSLDRRELGKAADYIVMMGYDEHWHGDQTAGSVASLPWIREGIRLLMNDVPSHKIILGVPFYTREWVTDLTSKKVDSIDRSLDEVNAIIAGKKLIKVWNDKTAQYYVEYTENNKKHQIWMEDPKSMEQRINVVKENHLGGAAAWYIGSESSDIWDVFQFDH